MSYNQEKTQQPKKRGFSNSHMPREIEIPDLADIKFTKSVFFSPQAKTKENYILESLPEFESPNSAKHSRKKSDIDFTSPRMVLNERNNENSDQSAKLPLKTFEQSPQSSIFEGRAARAKSVDTKVTQPPILGLLSDESKRESSFDIPKTKDPYSPIHRSLKKELDTSAFSDLSNKRKDDNDIIKNYKKRGIFAKPLIISQTFDALVDQAKGKDSTFVSENYPSYKVDKRLIFLQGEVKYPFVIIPYRSPFRQFWNIFIIAIILYEICWHPFSCTFYFGEPWPLGFLVFEISTLAIFFADIVINFRTTYLNEDNEEIVSFKMIGNRYVKSKLFYLDLFTLIPFQEIILLFLMGSEYQWKVYSFLVLVRVLRILKIPTYLKNRNMGMTLKLVYLIIICLIIEHWTSCLWYGIVKAQMDIDSPLNKLWFPPNVRESSAGDQDLLAFYDSMSIGRVYGSTLLGILMLSLGSDMGPVTQIQTGYCFLVALLGAVGLAFLYAKVTQIIFTKNEEDLHYQEKLEELKEKLKINDIPHNLRTKVMEYFHYSWKKRSVLKEMKDFNEISIPLQRDVDIYQYHYMISRVPLFKELDPIEILSIIQQLKTAIYMPGDKIIREGDKGTEMFFIQDGSVEILTKRSSFNLKETTRPKFERAFLGKGDYFGEISLFSNCKIPYNVNAFEFCILYTYKRSDYDMLKREFSDIGPRLRTGLRHYKNARIGHLLLILKDLDIFQGFTDAELVRLCDEYLDEVFVDPNKVILTPKKKTNAIYIMFGGNVNCYPETEATRNYVTNLRRSDAKNNWTIVDMEEKEEIDCLDNNILNLEKDRLSMEDDQRKLDLLGVYDIGDYFGTLDFKINDVKNNKYFLTDNGCHMGVISDDQKIQMAEDDPEIYSKLQANCIKIFPKRDMAAIDEESDTSYSTSKNNTLPKNTLSRKASIMSDFGKIPNLNKRPSLNAGEDIGGVKGELQRLGEEMNMFQELVADIHTKIDRIIPVVYPNSRQIDLLSPNKLRSKTTSLEPLDKAKKQSKGEFEF